MNIVITDGATLNPGDLSWAGIEALGTVTLYDDTPLSSRLERMKSADILVVNKVVIDRPLLASLPRLKYIAVTATGYNNIDVAYCHSKGIAVSNVVNYGSTTVAQHVFALLLELTNRVGRHHQLVQEGVWKENGSFSFWESPIVELAGKTMGIIGMGHTGQKVAGIAEGFEMKVLYTSSKKAPVPAGTRTDLKTLAASSDVISLNTHLHDGNREFVNADFLSMMRPTAYLINTARGGLINENDLAAALKEGRIAGAALDVLSEEPPSPSHPLLGLPNCLLTPHNAWASVEARRRMMKMTEENIQSFLKGRPMNLVH